MSNEHITDERLAFEKAARQEGCTDFKRVGDAYTDRRTLRCYRIWQRAIALRPAAQPDEEWIDARKVMPPPSKWPKRYLVILDSESPTQHCKDWAGRGEPEIAAFCSQWPYPWSARGDLSVAYWMPLPKFLKRWDQTVEGKPGRWIDA